MNDHESAKAIRPEEILACIVGSPPFASNASVRRMGCGDVRLLTLHAHLCIAAERRAGLIKLTVPSRGPYSGRAGISSQ